MVAFRCRLFLLDVRALVIKVLVLAKFSFLFTCCTVILIISSYRGSSGPILASHAIVDVSSMSLLSACALDNIP